MQIDLVWVVLAVVIGLAVVSFVALGVPRILTRKVEPGDIELLKLRNDIRSTLLQAVAGSLFLVTAVGTVIQINNENEKTQRELQQAGDQQLSTRFSDALKLLAGDDVTARIGGVYALRAVADDSRYYQGPIIDTLIAYVRQQKSGPVPNIQIDEPNTCLLGGKVLGKEPVLLLDMQRRDPVVHAILGVLGDWDYEVKGIKVLDLASLDLRSSEIYYGHLEHGLLTGAQLQLSKLDNAILNNSSLLQADLRGATLKGTSLIEANLSAANFGPPDEARGNFRYLRGADLTGAHLEGANVTYADLSGANLSDITFDSITDFKGAKYDSCTKFPSGLDPIKSGMVRLGTT